MGSFLVATGATHFLGALFYGLFFLGWTALLCAVSSRALGHDGDHLWSSLALRANQHQPWTAQSAGAIAASSPSTRKSQKKSVVTGNAPSVTTSL